jgi:hypothetical protein
MGQWIYDLLQMISQRLDWRGDVMGTSSLTDEEIQQIFLLGQRFLINESTHPDDLKLVLVERLRPGKPALAEKVERMDKDQVSSLCRMMLTRQQPYV